MGSCADRDKRVRWNNAGDTKATKHGIPWSLIHSEIFSTRPEATARERYYKTGRRLKSCRPEIIPSMFITTGRVPVDSRTSEPEWPRMAVLRRQAREDSLSSFIWQVQER